MATATATKKKAQRKAPSAIDLLKEDHSKVRDLLEKLEKAQKAARRTKLLEQIKDELQMHVKIEEEIFYPAFRKAVDTKEGDKMFFEAHEEHRAVDDLVLPDLEKTNADSEKFSGRAKVLKELVEHHADEEEEEMFPKARKAMGAEMLREVGARMEARKKELKRR
jgi:iron-sulfur cluster repair protein YtfE (RIC family)